MIENQLNQSNKLIQRGGGEWDRNNEKAQKKKNRPQEAKVTVHEISADPLQSNK